MKFSALGKSSRPLFLSTLVLFDVETTGLPSANFNPEITELCMLACSRFSLENATDEPRVENKLTLCFNPTRTISSIASKISGLNSDNLFHQRILMLVQWILSSCFLIDWIHLYVLSPIMDCVLTFHC
ncbi:unnamed protein product [Schistosoma mattheei]|uniref:Exonuclease domain-containing protein n=1 Tax=Schistosoma mattheei TaxID=31246 RepID=A0AA85BKQ2_9TREM|nr:unnamed protein product [Schistosoma mattheei]